MNRCFTPVSFWSKYVFIFFTLIFAASAVSAQNTVSGRIVDSANAGISRVSVSVRGTQRGAVTDADGNFRVSASPGQVLVISYLGYVTQEIPVRGSGAINVTLSPDARQLSDVVVVGYGQKNRRLLTESIGTVGSKDIQKLPVASADQAIQGRVSGVQITSSDGAPGSPVSIRIRGVGTVGNAQPLFVIDGVPIGNGGGSYTNPLSTINPNDIENISVLKDASSAAIYGMRAANGVVLITTKRGRSGKPRVTLDAYYGVAQFPRKLDLLNSKQLIDLAQEAVTNFNTQRGYTPADTLDYRQLHVDFRPGSSRGLANINTNWQDAVINKNAPVANYNVGLSGGTENSNYFFSVGYFKQEAVTTNWDLERYSARVNSDYKVGNRLKIGQTLSMSFQEVNRGMNGGGDGYLYANAISMPPFFKIYDEDNSIPGNRYGFNGNLDVGGITRGNQVALNQIVLNKDHTYRLLGGVYAELELLKGLKARSAASIDLGFSRNTGYQPAYTAAEIGFGREANNSGDSRAQNYTQVFTNTLGYDKVFGEHTFNVLGGIEYQKIRGNNLGYSGTNFQSTDPSFYQVVSNGRAGSSGYANATAGAYNEAFASYFGRLSYNFKDKYLLTATVRSDGTSRFAPGNRWGVFPAVSAAWRVSEEDFFQSVPAITDLKIRGSWGRLGNANTSNFAYISRVSFTPQYPIGGSPQQAPLRPELPSAQLGWETVQSFDLGFDATLFNKFSVLATYYKRNTLDFLYKLPVSSVSGFQDVAINLGEVENKGFEFELGYNTSVFKNLNLNFNANFTTVKNKLVALAPGVQEYSAGADNPYRTGIGYPIGYFYGYKAIGIYQTPADAANALPDNLASGNDRPQAGDVIFEDNNSPLTGSPDGKQFADTADGKITPEDRTYLGKTIPDFFYGFNIGANFKGFDLAIFFQGVSGVQVYNALRRDMEGLAGVGSNRLASVLDRWTGPGTSNTMPRAIESDPADNGRISSRWIENAGFLRLKNVQIGYSLPQSLIARSNAFKSARIYIGATNLFVITDYKGLDPEVLTFSNYQNDVSTQTGAGTDQGSTPQPRTFQAGFQLGF
ncbi:MAG: Outer membrane TonB-dependent transporter, utilization system for glycans and polysaccharides (PUL), SusC family [uncultured Segetibacter sp.]|uniref:Outer membrane TonB-dependent transporter, utilization system for glycans and polysaccharides (PUL), SusC family n=1 Tax=uncultured Segetibacter sp. TaxID=481133 RepID=A0A6J4U0D9_9BACT|nr:MAG: Outer membrane TonB-dependent transporter, utilization system for glycans and polysaccharides (PUL), SusC family [uncultured Segetibacter sp.]